MDVSIIIVNYKTPDLVIDCVNSIRKLTKDITYEIIVVDNASNDDSVKIINEKFHNDIKLIESDVNLGFGKANNLGVDYANGEYVFLLNSDTILVNNAIKILYEYIMNNQDVGIVGGNLYSIDMKENSSFSMSFDDIETLKKQASWINIILNNILRQIRQRLFSEEQRRKVMYKHTFNYTNSPLEVGYIFGTDMMLSKQLFKKMNGFDPEFFMYAEEEEFSWRIHQAGYKIVNVPTAKIIHLDGGTFKRDDSFNSRQFSMRMTGAMTYYKKRFGEKGINDYYFYKHLRLTRQNCLAKILKRNLLFELTQKQMKCLEEQYNNIVERKK